MPEFLLALRNAGLVHPVEPRLIDNFSLHNILTFPAQEFIRLWVEHKKKQQQDEQRLWRFAGAAVGMMFGLGDGFQIGDLLGGLAGGAMGALAQEALSSDDKAALDRMQLNWVHADHGSPIRLVQRHGRPVARYMLTNGNSIITCVGFQDGYLAILETGGAKRFLAPLQDEAKQSGFINSEWVDGQLAHGASFRADGRGFLIKQERRLATLPATDGIVHDVMALETDNGNIMAIKSSIPHHSEY
jgi:hypothetical protein